MFSDCQQVVDATPLELAWARDIHAPRNHLAVKITCETVRRVAMPHMEDAIGASDVPQVEKQNSLRTAHVKVGTITGPWVSPSCAVAFYAARRLGLPLFARRPAYCDAATRMQTPYASSRFPRYLPIPLPRMQHGGGTLRTTKALRRQ